MNNIVQYSPQQDNQSKFRNRLFWCLGFIFIGFGILFSRLFFLQLDVHEKYQLLSDENRIKLISLAPPRGKIFDIKGNLLAENRTNFVVVSNTKSKELITKEFNKLRKAIPSLKQLDFTKIEKNLKDNPSSISVVIYDELTPEEADIFAVSAFDYEYLEMDTVSFRYYPYGKSTVHFLGYVNPISKEEKPKFDIAKYRATKVAGKSGLEQLYESTLHGFPGVRTIETNAKGRQQKVLAEKLPTPGQDLTLYIDVDLQQYAESLLQEKRGAIVAINPASGGIMAFVSSPNYDPNEFVGGVSSEYYNSLLVDKDKPLLNRVTYGQYPPGSVVKPFVALVGLEKEIITENTTIISTGFYEAHNRVYRDWKKGGHGKVDTRKAIVESVDTFFYDLASKITIDGLEKGLSPFGFGQSTGIDLPNEKMGILPSPKWKKDRYQKIWYPGETIITGIGQGFFLATPLQMARATSILANRGEMVIPKLVQDTEQNSQNVHVDQGTEAIEEADVLIETGKILIKKRSNWELVIDSMKDVMHAKNGTAKSSGYLIDFQMAGKTGTAQVFSLKKDEEYVEEEIKEELRDHSLFVGFAPVENPEIVVAVIVENGGPGSKSAAPIGAKVVKKFFELESL